MKISIAALVAACVAVGLVLIPPDRPSSASSPKYVSVFPSPGTPVASDRTQITFRGIKKSRSGPIRVTGSKSGRHRGRLRADSDGRGFSFLPKRPFKTGERVRVRTRLRILGGRSGDFSFRISNLRPSRPARGGPVPKQRAKSRFRSRPRLKPPPVKVDVAAHDTAPGYIFLSPKSAGGMIVDNRGKPVWYRPMRSSNLRVQRYRGRNVLTWWQAPTGRQRTATYMMVDHHYRPIRRLKAGNGYSGDLHEFRLTRDNTALITAYRAVKKDLRPVGGPRNGVVLDSIAQEIDVKTGLVLWEWHSLGNVPIKDSYRPPPKSGGGAWDYFHINSVAQMPDGNILVSGREPHALYKIDHHSGKIIWQMGGKRSDFRIGKKARFKWQHAAVPLSGGRIALFDNRAIPQLPRPRHQQSRGIIIGFDAGRHKAWLDHAYRHRPDPLLSNSQANTQVLPNGNVLVGWGANRNVTEFSAGGKVLFDLSFDTQSGSYRAYRSPWTGLPRTRPAIATKRSGGGRATVWLSWNGATEIRRWRVLAGSSKGSLRAVATRPRTGFETRIVTGRDGRFLRAEALGADGKLLGRTATVRVGRRAG